MTPLLSAGFPYDKDQCCWAEQQSIQEPRRLREAQDPVATEQSSVTSSHSAAVWVREMYKKAQSALCFVSKEKYFAEPNVA